MGSNYVGIDHDVDVVGVFQQYLENPLPDARLGPTGEALVHTLPIAILTR